MTFRHNTKSCCTLLKHIQIVNSLWTKVKDIPHDTKTKTLSSQKKELTLYIITGIYVEEGGQWWTNCIERTIKKTSFKVIMLMLYFGIHNFSNTWTTEYECMSMMNKIYLIHVSRYIYFVYVKKNDMTQLLSIVIIHMKWNYKRKHEQEQLPQF